MSVSSRPGMGAIAFDGGTTFRVWAPFASSVAVTGTWNQWSDDASPLSSEGASGTWSADIPGAKPGHEYKFALRGKWIGGRSLKNDPYALSMTGSNGNGIIKADDFVWRVDDWKMPAWNDLVIYELDVGAFAFDTEHGRRGDFGTVIAKLGYLRDLGINAIHVMPADEFPGEVSWGYNPSDIFAIEESYGGPNGFRALVDTAHAFGIAVIFDVVYNHLGPTDLDLWRFDGWTPNDDPHDGGIYFYNDWRQDTPWGARPDYGRPEVRQYLRDNALHWLLDARCDGLRVDATNYIRSAHGENDDAGAALADGWSLLRWINDEVHAHAPWKITIAEDMQDNEVITRPTSSGGAGFGAQWGAGFMHRVRDMLVASEDSARDMHALAGLVEQRFNGDAFQRVVYTESHDEVAYNEHDASKKRLPEAISPGNATGFFAQKRSTLGAGIVFTSPGIPMIFMGQELLEWGAWQDNEEIDWSKVQSFGGIHDLYRDLIRLRRNLFGTTNGLRGQNAHVFHVNDNDKVIAFHRWQNGGPKDDVVVVANFGNKAYDAYRIGFPRGGSWKLRFNGDWNGYSSVFTNHPAGDTQANDGNNGDGMPFGADVSVGPYAVLIFSQDD